MYVYVYMYTYIYIYVCIFIQHERSALIGQGGPDYFGECSRYSISASS